jgi:biopolymer transport protein ExbD
MLLTRQKQEPAAPQLNMASMVDVVFLLLIFFMCTSSFTQIEDKLPTQLSQVGTGANQETMELPPIRIILHRNSSGAVLTTCENEDFLESEFRNLVRKLKEWRAIDDMRVIIEGQGTVPFGYMVRALDACYQAELRRVAFSAKGGEI